MTEFWDMTRSELRRMEKAELEHEYFLKFGPRCATCRKAVNFTASAYPYALSRDVAYCKEYMELMETPGEPSEELDCWEG